MTKGRSNKILKSLKKFYGTPETGLKYVNLYQLAVSVILSAQTTDIQVNSVTPELFRKYKDFRNLSKAKRSEIEKIIKSTGFYRNKSRNIINLAKTIVDEYKGKLPHTLDELVKLPGIGRKSANVILSIGYNIPALAVDTHVLRIANRLGYIESPNPHKVEIALTSYIPKNEWNTSHLLLIKHGRTICKAIGPLCGECPVNSLCDFSDKNL